MRSCVRVGMGVGIGTVPLLRFHPQMASNINFFSLTLQK